MARALITGIAGFAGSHLAEHLLECGDEVQGIVQGEGPQPNLAAVAGRVATHVANLTDLDAVRAALDRAAPDSIYHLAAFTSPRLSYADPIACYQVNALGTGILFEAVRRSSARPRVLCLSSAEVYGRAGPAPVPETAPLRPISPYGASKIAAEMIAIAAFEADGIPAIRARAFNHIGPRQDASFATPSFAKQVAGAEIGAGPPEIRVGNIAPVRELNDVRDVVRGYRLLLARGVPGEVYNVASGRGLSIGAFLDALLLRAKVPLEIAVDAGLGRPADIDHLIGDPARFEQATGMRLDRPIADTIDALLQEWRERMKEDR